jgi:hypothetical protein
MNYQPKQALTFAALIVGLTTAPLMAMGQPPAAAGSSVGQLTPAPATATREAPAEKSAAANTSNSKVLDVNGSSKSGKEFSGKVLVEIKKKTATQLDGGKFVERTTGETLVIYRDEKTKNVLGSETINQSLTMTDLETKATGYFKASVDALEDKDAEALKKRRDAALEKAKAGEKACKLKITSGQDLNSEVKTEALRDPKEKLLCQVRQFEDLAFKDKDGFDDEKKQFSAFRSKIGKSLTLLFQRGTESAETIDEISEILDSNELITDYLRVAKTIAERHENLFEIKEQVEENPTDYANFFTLEGFRRQVQQEGLLLGSEISHGRKKLLPEEQDAIRDFYPTFSRTMNDILTDPFGRRDLQQVQSTIMNLVRGENGVARVPYQQLQSQFGVGTMPQLSFPGTQFSNQNAGTIAGAGAGTDIRHQQIGANGQMQPRPGQFRPAGNNIMGANNNMVVGNNNVMGNNNMVGGQRDMRRNFGQGARR